MSDEQPQGAVVGVLRAEASASVTRPRAITATAFHDALVAAGVIRDGEHIRRVIIDAQAGHAVMVHVERFGDERLLSVARTLDGIEVHYGTPAKLNPNGTPADQGRQSGS